MEVVFIALQTVIVRIYQGETLSSWSETSLFMDGVLNVKTGMIHKQKPGSSNGQTVCGATRHVSHNHLQLMSVQQALDDDTATKCGRCFADVGGY